MSKVQILRALVQQRLTAAAEEIFGLVERTIAEYEEELCRSKEENDQHRKLMDAVFNPQLRLHRADVQQLLVVKEEVPPEQQEWSSSVDQEDPEPPHIKGEQEKLWISQEGEQLQGLEEDDIIKFTFIPVPVKSEDDEEKPQSSQLHQRHTEQMETEAEGEDCGGPEPARNSDPDTHLHPETDDKTGESSDPENSSVDQEDPEPPYIKEEQEKLWISQEGEKLQGLEEDNITKFTSTPVPVKSEDDEEKPQSSQLHQRHTEQMETEADGEDCGGAEPARNSYPDTHLQLETDDSDDWTETREPQSGLNSLKNDDVPVSDLIAREKPFSCPECGKRFGRNHHLKDHMRSHTGKKPFNCSECGKLFSRSGVLKIHMRAHTGEKPISCSKCGERFRHSGILNTHMRSHTGEKPFRCSDCGRRFGHSRLLTTHMRSHTGEKPFRCSECGKRFSHSEALKIHMKCHTREKPFCCPECGRRFRERGNLKIHMRTHTGEKPFSCSECGESFDDSGVLKVHLMCHTGEKPFSCGGPEPARNSDPDTHLQSEAVNSHDWKETRETQSDLNSLEDDEVLVSDLIVGEKRFRCSECGKRFRRRRDLKNHMNSHTGNKPFSCSDCGKLFSRSDSLKRHMRSHTGEKPFSCSECGKRFRHKGYLAVHMRSHTGEKPFNCSECGKKFSHSESLRAHMRSHTGEKPFSCSQCGKRFRFRADVKTHMSSHTGERPFTCSVCCRRFVQSGDLKKHMRSHTGEKPFSCSECGKRFGYMKNLKAHVRYHTGETI